MDKRLDKHQNFRAYIEKSIKERTMFLQTHFRHLDVHSYVYDAEEAMEELGLDEELIHQLIEDYVRQILNSKAQFVELLDKLKQERNDNKTLNYTPIRELAHKNLGVARNLRIEDAIKFLEELMVKDDLDYLGKCIMALESCAIKLKPLCAYETIKLIKLKNSL